MNDQLYEIERMNAIANDEWRSKLNKAIADRDEWERKAELLERMHDERVKALRETEVKLSKIAEIKFDYDGYQAALLVDKLLQSLTTEIANAADALSMADLAASGGIVEAP